jgi:hypothetical protein
MKPIGWIIIGVGALWGVLFIAALIAKGHPAALRRRPPAGAEWRRTGCSADTVDRILEVTCDTFGFSPKMKLKLRPDDTIPGLYLIVYPRRHLMDQLEIESFLFQLEKVLGQRAEDIELDTTSLAEIATRIDTNKGGKPSV